jgi:tRNA threonylcarbamoyladenosine biosynthesis protein TsaE
MRAYGERLGRGLRAGDWVALSGDLGSGKTTLVSGILEGIHPGARGRSPTYVLIEVYGTRPTVLHADLFRLRSPAEYETLGLEDLARADAVVLIEWADRATGRLPAERLDLSLAFAGEDAREVLVTPRGASWEARLREGLGRAARTGAAGRGRWRA